MLRLGSTLVSPFERPWEGRTLNVLIGYGATTLPALSEAILYEQNATLVEHEVTRLSTLLTKLAHTIEP